MKGANSEGEWRTCSIQIVNNKGSDMSELDEAELASECNITELLWSEYDRL
jgi:hypothetical protein